MAWISHTDANEFSHLHFHASHPHDIIFDDDGYGVGASCEASEEKYIKEKERKRADVRFRPALRTKREWDSLLRAQGAGLIRLPSSARDQKATVNQNASHSHSFMSGTLH